MKPINLRVNMWICIFVYIYTYNQPIVHWMIGSREQMQETLVFTPNGGVFLQIYPQTNPGKIRTVNSDLKQGRTAMIFA